MPDTTVLDLLIHPSNSLQELEDGQTLVLPQKNFAIMVLTIPTQLSPSAFNAQPATIVTSRVWTLQLTVHSGITAQQASQIILITHVLLQPMEHRLTSRGPASASPAHPEGIVLALVFKQIQATAQPDTTVLILLLQPHHQAQLV